MSAGDARLGGSESEIDACSRCLFVWLDADEYACVPRKVASVPAQTLSPASRAATARLAVEVQRERSALEQTGAYPDSLWKSVIGRLGLPVEVEQRPLRLLPLLTWVFAFSAVAASLFAWRYGMPEVVRHTDWLWRHSLMMNLLAVAFFRGFAHADVFQLALCVYFLLAFGGRVEEARGGVGWLVLFLVCAAAGHAVAAFVSSPDDGPWIATSASVAGMLAWYVLEFPYVTMGWGPFALSASVRTAWLSLPARWLLPMYGLIQLGCAIAWSSFALVLACLAGAAAGALVWFTTDGNAAWRRARGV